MARGIKRVTWRRHGRRRGLPHASDATRLRPIAPKCVAGNTLRSDCPGREEGETHSEQCSLVTRDRLWHYRRSKSHTTPPNVGEDALMTAP
eukprot:scaffold1938_cov399-Prasinococcus_capsulatus_cf.AAC.33